MNERQIRRVLSRRTALKGAMFGAAGLAMLGRTGMEGWAAPRRSETATRPGTAKSVIEIWLWGGPSHIDTFDPKPQAGRDYCGPLDKAISTNAPGVQLNGALPMLAQQADKFSILRSVTHGNNGHETAAYITQTGRRPGFGEGGLVYPSFGAIVSAFKGVDNGYSGMIPPYVLMTRPIGRFAVEGFLGLKHKPFVTGGDPNRQRFAVEGIVQENVSQERQKSRRELLHELDALGQALKGHAPFRTMDECEEKAYDLILGDAGKVFDLNLEPDAVRERYGRTTLGQSCLAARRLVEIGVPYVTIVSPGWDSHQRHFETMNQRLPDLDRSMSALFEDLGQRGLLDSTIVWWGGEFGRTPKVQWDPPWNGGRSHFGRVFSLVVGGGGFQGGQVVGASDDKASYVADRPIEPHDVLSSMLIKLGIDPDGKMPNARGLDVPVQEPSQEGRGVGRLTEIM